MTQKKAVFTLLLVPLALALLGSTCVVVEEGDPYAGDVPYGEESNAEATQEEATEEVMRESDL